MAVREGWPGPDGWLARMVPHPWEGGRRRGAGGAGGLPIGPSCAWPMAGWSGGRADSHTRTGLARAPGAGAAARRPAQAGV
jgi:hypothetical protein